jgi:hypothetical protein
MFLRLNRILTVWRTHAKCKPDIRIVSVYSLVLHYTSQRLGFTDHSSTAFVSISKSLQNQTQDFILSNFEKLPSFPTMKKIEANKDSIITN